MQPKFFSGHFWQIKRMEELIQKFADLKTINTAVIDETKQVLSRQKSKKAGIAIIKEICVLLSNTKTITNNARKLDYCITITNLALQSLNVGGKWQSTKFEPERCACNVLSKIIELGAVIVWFDLVWTCISIALVFKGSISRTITQH